MSENWEIALQEFAEKIDVNLSTVVRRVAGKVYGDIIKAWPVDTGYSRRNWQVSADTPASGTVGVAPKKGAEALEPLYDPSTIPLKKGDMDVWIVNNVEYAAALEYGHSKQAPNGAVRIALAKVAAQIEATEIVEPEP